MIVVVARLARSRLVPILAALTLAGCAATSGADHASAPGTFTREVVAADHSVAAAAGAEILRKGGNAVDAAVATSFCLSVVRPYSCGIGGGGFMIIHRPGGPSVAINYRETAPAAVDREYFVRRDDPLASRFGTHAIGVPGTVAGLLYAHSRYGRLPRRVVMAPAIRAAEGGFPADAHFVKAAKSLGDRLEEHPELRDDAAFIWRQLCHSGRLRVGDPIVNPAQGRALRMIAAHGAPAFYQGAIAEAIVAAVQRSGGVLTRADLEDYAPNMTPPLQGAYGPYGVIAMPPPSSGGVAMLQILGLLERLDVTSDAGPDATWRHDHAEYTHLVTEAMKHAFADRAEWLADPAFVRVPTDMLLDADVLDLTAAKISASGVAEPKSYGTLAPPPDDAGTSHFSVLDKDGMAVACTETINLAFGSLVAVPAFGFVLNDEMDDFTTVPGAPNAFGLRQSDRNLPAPGKRPLSSMSPTILIEDGQVVMIIGAAGGPRIITGTTQTMLNTLLFDMAPDDAIAAPRFHHQWLPDVIEFEESWTDQATIDALMERGQTTGRRKEVGHVQMIHVRNGIIHAAADPRKGGSAEGQ